MKFFKTVFKINLLVLGAYIYFCACNKASEKMSTEATASFQTNPNFAENSKLKQDSIELLKLTKDLYQWVESPNNTIDFEPILKNKKDTIYYRLDSIKLKQNIDSLSQSGFFAKEFLNNYNNIAKKIDQRMLDQSLVYVVGNVPPYGPNANPWCLCQDNPDNYWNLITLKNLQIDRNHATYEWTWGDDLAYKVKANKENGKWKIAYLEGFDYEGFLSE